MKLIYYLYHIKGKKIGVTCNPINRIENQQGYKKDEYEILEYSYDIDYISLKEIELQKSFGYKVDEQLYRDTILNKKKIMTVNITEQTTTFSVPTDRLKEELYNNLGMEIIKAGETAGHYVLTRGLADYIVLHACHSLFSKDRCYIYNRLLEVYAEKALEEEKPCVETETTVFDKIRDWARDKGILIHGDIKTQYIKLQEESGELAQAILKNDDVEFVDAIGDMVVVLTNLAALKGLRIEKCIDSAYNIIKNRSGVMVNGTFRKESYEVNSTVDLNNTAKTT
jgi:phosphoribosyl-ATP pyrophosphohydrolase